MSDTDPQTAAKLEEPMLRYFAYDHLREPDLRETSKLFHQLAHTLVLRVPRTPERTVALRKLLEGKDAAVRATLDTLRPA